METLKFINLSLRRESVDTSNYILLAMPFIYVFILFLVAFTQFYWLFYLGILPCALFFALSFLMYIDIDYSNNTRTNPRWLLGVQGILAVFMIVTTFKNMGYSTYSYVEMVYPTDKYVHVIVFGLYAICYLLNFIFAYLPDIKQGIAEANYCKQYHISYKLYVSVNDSYHLSNISALGKLLKQLQVIPVNQDILKLTLVVSNSENQIKQLHKKASIKNELLESVHNEIKLDLYKLLDTHFKEIEKIAETIPKEIKQSEQDKLLQDTEFKELEKSIVNELKKGYNQIKDLK